MELIKYIGYGRHVQSKSYRGASFVCVCVRVQCVVCC